MAVIDTRRGALECEELGGGGPTLVLLTGFGATIGHWAPSFVDPLARERHVVLVQNPGVGASTPTAGGCGGAAEHVAALLDALAIPTAAVLGWSMGGMTAQALAATRSDLVGTLVLAASAPGTGTAVAPGPGALRTLASGAPEAMLEVLFPDDPNGAAAYRDDLARRPPLGTVPPAVLAAQGEATRRWRRGLDPAGRRTPSITAPALLVQGGRDALCPPANADRLAEVLRDTDTVRIAGAGLGVLFADPAERAAEILRWTAPTT